MEKEQPIDRADWIERWERGDLYREIAADAGVSESTVGLWFRTRGFSRYDQADPSPYSQYPPPVRRLIEFYPEGSAQRRWMERRAAAWWDRQGKR